MIIPIIAYHNLCYIKFLTHMEQTVQQYDVPPPNYKLNEHATHGLSHRPSLAQITSFFVISFTIAVYFSCNLALLILYCTTLAVLVVSSAQASLTNPTDRVVYYYKWSKHDKKVTFSPEYDKILFCQFCDSYCFANSKHCKTCNRCVDKFDHHCMWFNNCVGQRNYNYFLVSILSTFFYAVVFIVHVVLSSIKTNFGDMQQVTKIVIGWIGALIMVIFGFLLFNLIALHLYLIATEQTTYQFLQKRKKEEEQQKKKLNQRLQQQQKIANNKVMPEHNPQRHQAVSQQSIANNKLIVVARHEEEDDAKTDHLNKSSPVNKSRQDFKIQMNEMHNKQLIFNEALSAQSKGNYIDQREHEQDQSVIKDNEKSLPNFFRKNRSLKFMLPQMQAQSPSKSRKNISDVVLHQV